MAIFFDFSFGLFSPSKYLEHPYFIFLDLKKLAKLLRENPDINVDAQDTHGNTALHIAAVKNYKFYLNSKKYFADAG